jgi:O-glycosyl hydrolase
VHGAPEVQAWDWWVRGWSATPQGTLPPSIAGFSAYGKRSWMTETSGDQTFWPTPAMGAAQQGALHVAIKIHHALTAGAESAWLHWQFAEDRASEFSLTDREQGANGAKYVAAKHFFKPIRPDAKRIEASASAPSLLVSAYLHEADQTLTVVAINTGTTDQVAPISVQGLTGRLIGLRTYTSSPAARWQVGQANPEQPAVTVPAYGIVTLQAQVALPRATLARGKLYRASAPAPR